MMVWSSVIAVVVGIAGERVFDRDRRYARERPENRF
jgi:hypothetical protein